MVGLDAAGKTTILYKLKLGEIVTTIPTIGMHKQSPTSMTYCPGTEVLWADHLSYQALMSKLSNIRTFNLLSGMLVDKTRSVLCGDITSRTPKVSSLSLTATIVTELSRLGKSCSACSTRMSLEMPSSLFSRISKIYLLVDRHREVSTRLTVFLECYECG